jgi:hypothetical protein
MLSVVALAIVVASGCRTPSIAWLATDGVPAARAPSHPSKCALDRSVFHPSRPVLIGSPPSGVVRWAKTQLPTNYRVGRDGTLGLVPSREPGTALHARIRGDKVVMIEVQNHARTATDVVGIAEPALGRFLLDAAGCSSFRICAARANIDDLTFTGYTTCPAVRVPVRIVASPHRREINAVAVWLPDLLDDTMTE